MVTLTLNGTNQSAQMQVQDYETFRVVSAYDPHAPAAGTFSLQVSKPGWGYSFSDVDLQGVVDSNADKNLVYIRARGVPGIFSVTNNLVVAK